MTFVIAVYELNRQYGGPEEGGWWYDCGQLVKTIKTFKNEDRAYDYCRKFNRRLSLINRNVRYPLHSVCYAGGILRAEVRKDRAPEHWPPQRPYYE